MLKAADMTVQSTQLLHLAEETSDLAQDGGLSKDTTDNVWDAKLNKIKNLLDPTDPGDAVTLNYITKNQDSLLTQLRNTGAAQNSSIVSTGDTQNARLTATGDTQNTRLNTTGDTQDKRLNDLGQKYVDLMTTLKDTATTKATEASNSAELSKKWAMSDTSPDGVTGNKSSKTWAGEAKTSASNANASASASQSSANASSASATQSANSASASKSSANASASSASASASSASAASTSASNAKTSETNAANSAKAAKQSEENAKTWDPTQYVQSVTEANGKVTVTKGDGESTTFNAGINILARNKAYSAGDIAYSPNLSSYLYLECTTAGTTGAIEPDMSTVSGGMVNDGTAKFSVKTVCAKEYVDTKVSNDESKWKKAYNALRKRSYPIDFDNDELTILLNTEATSGTLTLSQPYTDFDGLLIEFADNDENAFNLQYISTVELNYKIARSIDIKGGEKTATISFISGEQYWRIWCGKSRGFTTTTFPCWTENCNIFRIYGVKFKEIT